MTRLTRRKFLKTATAGAGLAATFTIAGTKSSGQVVGANDTIRVCVAGINGRGTTHIDSFGGIQGVKVTHLVDPDQSLWNARGATVARRAGATPKCFTDLRKALEDKDIDVVSIASCNHWHSLLAIWAIQAGKDVYCEKPCCHNVFEGRKLVEAARKYKRIVQHGTQNRSNTNVARAVAAAKSGKYGKLLVAYGNASKPRASLGIKPVEEPPKDLDFDIWTGPAPKQPFHKNLVHYNWHWFWDFGNGEIGNQGVHQMDIASWVVRECTGLKTPKSVISLGGRFGYQDQGQTPNTQLSILDFGETKIFFEDRGLKTNNIGDDFYMEEGVIRINDAALNNIRFFPKGSTVGEPLVEAPINIRPGGPFGNFINCVRSRKQEELNAEIEDGLYSTILIHTANASYRLGEEVPFNQETKAFGDDKRAYESLENVKQHLVTAAGLNLDESKYRLGKFLQYDGAADKFVDNEEATKLLTRTYRDPYVVPEKV
jgi:predicted dehydrogenase